MYVPLPTFFGASQAIFRIEKLTTKLRTKLFRICFLGEATQAFDDIFRKPIYEVGTTDVPRGCKRGRHPS